MLEEVASAWNGRMMVEAGRVLSTGLHRDRCFGVLQLKFNATLSDVNTLSACTSESAGLGEYM